LVTTQCLEALADALAPGVTVEPGTGEAAIAEDTARFDRQFERKQIGRAVRLWTNRQCLVTTRRFARMENFAQAAAASAARGWPVHVRASGGTTVAHRSGMLNVSRYETGLTGSIDIAHHFEEFSLWLTNALRSIGVPASTGAIAGSHCDGRFNIVVQGRKVAGTACLLRQRHDLTGILAHATVWLDGEIDADIAAICDFERALGLAAAYRAEAHMCLSDWLDLTSAGVAKFNDGNRPAINARAI
jgi:octanoyl-[GcvH]:protein N-octanoyltransferase